MLPDQLAVYSSLFSDGSTDFVWPAPPHALGQRVTIRVRALAGVPIREIKLRTFPDGEERQISMKSARRGPFQYWSAQVAVTRRPFPYRFRVQTDRRVLWLNASGLHAFMPPDEEDFKLVPGFAGPGWVRESVFYQIFPDRFRCGREETGRAPRTRSPAFAPAVVRQWHEKPQRPNFGNEFYGGDLWGIREMLPHLEMLGINALYLTPVFEAPSNHRYDPVSYEQVDSFLGGNEALAALGSALQSRGMRYLLDGVFNHCGVNHPWFQDAAIRPESPFREYFTYPEYPREYVSWLGHKNLPKLDFASPTLRETIYAGTDSVARRWLREPYHAAGWRLDAPNMLGHGGTDAGNLEYWREFRAAVKAENPDAFLLGECFPEATKWLTGDTFDAVMNYRGFTSPMIQWLTGSDLHLNPAQLTAQETAAWMTSVLARMPFDLRNLQYNALSTHDIIRFITRVDLDEQRYRLAAILQMAWPGVPAIYYGEELGLAGGKDPDNRRPMPWDDVPARRGLLEFLARLIGLRRSLVPLRRGAFRFLAADDDCLAFTRFEGDHVLLIAANRGNRPQPLDLPVAWLGMREGEAVRSLISSASAAVRAPLVTNGRLKLILGPREAVWLERAPDPENEERFMR